MLDTLLEIELLQGCPNLLRDGGLWFREEKRETEDDGSWRPALIKERQSGRAWSWEDFPYDLTELQDMDLRIHYWDIILGNGTNAMFEELRNWAVSGGACGTVRSAWAWVCVAVADEVLGLKYFAIVRSTPPERNYRHRRAWTGLDGHATGS